MLVWATDPITGETALKPVVQTFVNQTNELVHVTVNGETITCTNEHPFYSPVKGWIAACQLRAGDVLVMLNGERIVVEQVQHELLESPVTVYNFEVERFHTYYVGDTEVLVHNTCGQNHHAISNKINREKIKNHNLDCISRNDPRFQVRALTPEGHRGYQGWHRKYDDDMVRWLQNNPKATADDFINELNRYYAENLQKNFGSVFFKL